MNTSLPPTVRADNIRPLRTHARILKILQSGKSGFRLLTLALALLFAQAANAENAAELKTTIEGYDSGTGNLSAAVDGNTVTVTGTKTGVTNYFGLRLNIDVDVTVIWKAELSGTSYLLLLINGAGILEVQSGGTISATTGTAIINSDNTTVNITGGTVSATSGIAVYNQGTAVNISGGEVKATTGNAVYINSDNFVKVSGTAKITSDNASTTEGTIYLPRNGQTAAVWLEITGGTVENTAANGNAVYNESVGSVSLGGSPDITGTIMKTYTGGLSVDGSFAPASDKTYTLGFTDISGVAVAGGASHISNFTLANNSVAGIDFSLSASGIDLVFLVTNGYAVAKSGTTYTITKGAGEIASVQEAIDNIKTQAGGNPCTIQFGNGTDALDIGGGNSTLINFDGTDNSWGLITLTGKLTTASTVNSYNNGIIGLTNGASIDSKAQIEATSSGNILYIGSGTATISGGYVKALGGGAAVYNCGTVNISGGEVSTTTGWMGAVYNYNEANISGGVVSATTGIAIWNRDSGRITVSGTAKITSARTSDYGTISLSNQSWETAPLKITGGTIENKAAGGNAVYNESNKAVNISGGIVLATDGYAVYKEGTGTTTITGGLVFAYGTADTDVIYGDYDATSGNAAIIAWDNTAGVGMVSTSTNIVANSGTTATWLNNDVMASISYANGTNIGVMVLPKMIPTGVLFPTAADITYDPAKTLADVALNNDGEGDGTFAWKDESIVPTVSNGYYNVVFTPTDAENYETLTNTVALSVAKANPPHTVPTGLTATVGQTLANVTLPSGWAWMDAADSVGAVGTRIHKANYTPSDAANYSTLTDIDVSIAVSKAKITKPTVTAASLVYTGAEQSAGIAANAAYTITNGSATNAGSHTATVALSDKANREWADGTTADLELAWAIAKASPAYTVPTGLTATAGQTLASVALPAGWAWVDATASVGAAGTQVHKAKFTPSDTENYNAVAVVDVSIAVSNPTPILAPQIATGSIRAQAIGNAIVLENIPSNAKVEVYSLQGKRVYSAYPENPKILKIGVQTKGVYVVKAGSKSARVAVK